MLTKRAQAGKPVAAPAYNPLFTCRGRLGLGVPKSEEFQVFISTAYAQTATGAAGSESSLLGLLPLVAVFVVMYFIMIRPQMKRQKEVKAMVEALAKGDEVVTTGGVIGKITKVGESILSIEVANGVELQLQRSAVVQVLPKGTVSATK